MQYSSQDVNNNVNDDNIIENEGLLGQTCLVEQRLCLDLFWKAHPSRIVAGIGKGHCTLITRLLTSTTGSLTKASTSFDVFSDLLRHIMGPLNPKLLCVPQEVLTSACVAGSHPTVA